MDKKGSKERMGAKLLELEKYVDRISKIVPKTAKDYKNSGIIVKGATERNLQLISDIEMDVLMLLYRALELSLGGDESHLLNAFSDRLSAATIDNLRKRRGLRNTLIHAYTESNYDEKVFEQASKTDDVLSFIKDAKRLI